MRRLPGTLIAAVSVIAFTQIATAADMPVKGPVAPPPPPPYSWTGFYIGANVGFSAGNADTDIDAHPVIVGLSPQPFYPATVTIPGFVGSEPAKVNGVIGGGQIGYNLQVSPNWVVGLEADIQGSGERGSRSFGIPFDLIVVTTPTTVHMTGMDVTNYEAKISWFGTVRGRIGYAWDKVMVYATGGLAYGEVDLDGTRTVSGSVLTTPFAIAHAIGHSHVNTGWTAGVGAEVALAGNWTGKFEYLYMDLGSLDDLDRIEPPTAVITSITGGQIITHTTFTDNIFRVGLNYKFY